MDDNENRNVEKEQNELGKSGGAFLDEQPFRNMGLIHGQRSTFAWLVISQAKGIGYRVRDMII